MGQIAETASMERNRNKTVNSLEGGLQGTLEAPLEGCVQGCPEGVFEGVEGRCGREEDGRGVTKVHALKGDPSSLPKGRLRRATLDASRAP